jgi:hypothetical protein
LAIGSDLGKVVGRLGGTKGVALSDRAVYKTFDVEILDDFYSGVSGTGLDVALQQGEKALEDSATQGLSSGFDQYTRFPQQRDDGTTPADFAGWLEGAGDDAERVVRLGYGEAVRLALYPHDDLPRPVPIDTFFVTGASEEFELHVCDGKLRVTVLMFMPDERPYGSTRADAKSWILRTARPGDPDDARIDDGTVVRIQRSGPAGPPAS